MARNLGLSDVAPPVKDCDAGQYSEALFAQPLRGPCS
jgi:hypothetical protein